MNQNEIQIVALANKLNLFQTSLLKLIKKVVN